MAPDDKTVCQYFQKVVALVDRPLGLLETLNDAVGDEAASTKIDRQASLGGQDTWRVEPDRGSPRGPAVEESRLIATRSHHPMQAHASLLSCSAAHAPRIRPRAAYTSLDRIPGVLVRGLYARCPYVRYGGALQKSSPSVDPQLASPCRCQLSAHAQLTRASGTYSKHHTFRTSRYLSTRQ